VAAWHDRDTVCLFHSDGNLWPVLDDLVAAGIDGLNPLEVLAGMSVGAVREQYPGLFLTGGIDVSQLLPLGTPEEVRTVCRQTIADAEGRGYLMGSSTELHWDVKLENAIAMFETAWEMNP
jgi:uroporphyrinogen decarboxylase